MHVHKRSTIKFLICFLLIICVLGLLPQENILAVDSVNLEEKIDRYIVENQEEIAGLGIAVIDGNDVFYKMEGHADIEAQIKVNENTVFEWGSVAKILIWISVFQLVEEGKLELDASISTYLPDDFQHKMNKSTDITMRHLLHHSAGFDDSYTDLMLFQPKEIASLKDVLEMANVKQVYPPGEILAYSNYGSGLAAYIVEQISGQDYASYVKEHIFDPLQMEKTAIKPDLSDNAFVLQQRQLIQGYTESLKLIEQNFYTIPMYPVGSVTGTLVDLQKLLQALVSKEDSALFTKKNTMHTLFEPSLYYPETSIPRMANGLFYLPSNSNHVFGHAGNTRAFSSAFYLDRSTQRGVIVLTNVANEATFTSGIPEIIFGPYIPDEYEGEFEDASKWQGIYEPARVARHGFSKILQLFLRSETKQTDSHHLQINDAYYKQIQPHIYQTLDEYSVYSLDVYSTNSYTKKMISNTYSDLIYLPKYQHILEWISIGLFLLAMIGSIIYLIISLLKRTRFQHLLFYQHLLNGLLLCNIAWIIVRTATMVSYTTLQPFLYGNIFYLIFSLILSILIIKKAGQKKGNAKHKWLSYLTLISTLIFSFNLIYWEFYY